MTDPLTAILSSFAVNLATYLTTRFNERGEREWPTDLARQIEECLETAVRGWLGQSEILRNAEDTLEAVFREPEMVEILAETLASKELDSSSLMQIVRALESRPVVLREFEQTLADLQTRIVASSSTYPAFRHWQDQIQREQLNTTASQISASNLDLVAEGRRQTSSLDRQATAMEKISQDLTTIRQGLQPRARSLAEDPSPRSAPRPAPVSREPGASAGVGTVVPFPGSQAPSGHLDTYLRWLAQRCLGDLESRGCEPSRLVPLAVQLEGGQVCSLQEFLAQPQSLILVGAPGSGKTTVLQALALAAAGYTTLGDLFSPLPRESGILERQTPPMSLPVPFWITPGDEVWVQDEQGRVFLEWEAKSASGAQAALRATAERGALVLLDAVDRVEGVEWPAVVKALTQTIVTRPGIRLIATCGPTSWDSLQGAIDGFQVGRLLPLSRGQIRRFVELCRPRLETLGIRPETLAGLVLKDPAVEQLVSRPSFLPLVEGLIPRQRSGGDLWRGLERHVASLLGWQVEGWVAPEEGAEHFEGAALAKSLGELARRLRRRDDGPRQGRAPLEEISGLLAAPATTDVQPLLVLEHLVASSGLLTVAEGGYGFASTLVEDLFAARGFVDSGALAELGRRARDQPDRWRGVVDAVLGTARRSELLEELWNGLCGDPPPARPTREDLLGALLASRALLAGVTFEEAKRLWLSGRLALAQRDERLTHSERVESGILRSFLEDGPEGDVLGSLEVCWVPVRSSSSAQGSDDPRGPFWIGRFPLTWSQARPVLSCSKVVEQEGRIGWSREAVWGDLPTQPVVRLSAEEADAIAAEITRRLRSQDLLAPGWRCRLPTATEWELATSGENGAPRQPVVRTLAEIAGDPVSTDDLEAYPPRPSEPTRGGGRSSSTTTSSRRALPVGCSPHRISPYGCEDMAGNVWEWCREDSGAGYVLKGGPGDPLLPATEILEPKKRSARIGFRLVVIRDDEST